MTERLTPNRDYVAPGVYIGERFSTGSPNVNPETRVATYLGRGSRYIRTKDQTIRRGFIYNDPMSFSTTAPHVAALNPASTGSKTNAVLVDSKGTEVRSDLWAFTSNNTAIQISDSTYDPTEQYFFSYQSADHTVPDPIPTADIRLIESVGSQISQDTYKRNVDYFVDCELLAPEAALNDLGAVIQHTNSVPVFSGISHVGTGTGLLTIASSSAYNHKYSRSYEFTVTDVAGTVVTLSWTATPTSFGNDSMPSVPVARGIVAPTLTFDTTNPQSLTLDVELGIRIDAGVGTYVENDTYSFSVTGPSLIEGDSAMSNTNQYASASAVLNGENNTGTGTIDVNAEAYSLGSNTKFVLQVTGVDTGVTVASVPFGNVTFTSNPLDSEGLVFENGAIGANRVIKTFEFTSDNVQSTPGSTLVYLASTSAVAATGHIGFAGTVSQAPADGSTITMTDGSRTATFEFDADGVLNNPSAIRVLIDATAGQQSAKTAANLVTAINASALTITAVDQSAGNSNIGSIALTHSIPGSVGNNTIITSNPTFITVSGFGGGLDAGSNTTTTIDNFVNAVNASYPRLGIVAERDINNSNSVNLIHGSRFVFSGNPEDTDTATVTLGSTSVVFEFVSTSTPGAGHVRVDIGGTLADTLNAFVAAINAHVLNIVGVVATSGGINTVTVASRIYRSLTLSKTSTAITSIVGDIVTSGIGYNNGNKAITALGSKVSNVSFSGMTGGVQSGDAPDLLTIAWGTAGDVFTGGTLTINETTADKVYVPLYAGVEVKLSKALATAARGSIAFNGVPSDGDTVTLTDHIAVSPIVFTFRTSPSLAHDVGIVSGNAASTAANLRTKIRASGLAFTIPSTETGSVITLTHNRTGSTYNTGITKSSNVLSIVDLTGGGNNYAVGNTYSFTALTPRKFATALDTRKVRLTVGTVGMNSPALVDPSFVMFGFSSNTPEGGFGTVESYSSNKGYFTLPGQISLVVRNATSMVKGDMFDVEFINNNMIYWTLDKKSTEVIMPTQILQDRNGAITGNAGSYYIVLRNVPYANTLTAVSAGAVFTNFSVVANTAIVLLNITSPSSVANIAFTYTHRGSEPALGSMYYVTAQYIRPASMYNVPTVFYDRESARTWLEPVTLGNDLAIANEIAFDQNAKAVAFIQVKDSDDDTVFSPTDIDLAISSAIGVSFITDITPVNIPNFLDKILAYNLNANDPFERKEQLTVIGMPIGTNVGSELEEGSLVFTAKRTLQVYGKSPAHGTRILVAPTMAKKKITYSDGSIVTAILDGSFVAAAISAKIASLPGNDTTILRQNIFGFDYIETFNESVNNILGAASTIYFQPNGTGIYQIMEDVTVDTQASHYQLILAMKTKHDSVRVMRREMEKRLIGYVADTKSSGVGFVLANAKSILMSQVGSGLIAPYQDEAGNPRPIGDSDVVVIQDEADPTLYHFRYTIFTRTPVKRIFGVYSVNETSFTGTL